MSASLQDDSFNWGLVSENLADLLTYPTAEFLLSSPCHRMVAGFLLKSGVSPEVKKDSDDHDQVVRRMRSHGGPQGAAAQAAQREHIARGRHQENHERTGKELQMNACGVS